MLQTYVKPQASLTGNKISGALHLHAKKRNSHPPSTP
jgi:hypothetical protein